MFKTNIPTLHECEKLKLAFKSNYVKSVCVNAENVLSQTNENVIKQVKSNVSVNTEKHKQSLNAFAQPFIKTEPFQKATINTCHHNTTNVSGTSYMVQKPVTSQSPSVSSSSNTHGVKHLKPYPCYACGKPGHNARHFLHRPTDFYYGKNQKVTPKRSPTYQTKGVSLSKVMNTNAPLSSQRKSLLSERFGKKAYKTKPALPEQLKSCSSINKKHPVKSSCFNKNCLPKLKLAWVPISK